MDNVLIAIITEDLDYGQTLGACLGDYSHDFIISVYQQKDLGDFISENFDIIFIDGESDNLEIRKINTVIQLCEKKSSRVMDFEKGLRKIWRYEKIDDMVRDILIVFEYNTGKTISVSKTHNTQIIGFISPCGGSGCTSVTWACLQEMHRFFGKKVLYISMEEIDSTSEFIRSNVTGRSPDELIYEVLGLKKTDEKAVLIESFLCSDEYGVKSLLPFRGANTFRSLSIEDLHLFFGTIRKIGDFDVIGIDFGCGISNSIIESYAICDRICFITDATRKRAKEIKVLGYLETLLGEEFIDKMVFIENKCRPGENLRDDSIKIDYEQISFCGDNITRIVPDKKFGTVIRELVKVLN